MSEERRGRARTHDSLRVIQRHAPRVTFVGVDVEVVDRVRALLQPAEVVALEAGPADRLCDAVLEIEPDVLFVTPDRDELFELVGELKVLPEAHFVPIIALGAPANRMRAYAAGVDHWVDLPLPVEELGARAAAAIRSSVVARAVRDSRQELRLRRDWSRFLVHDLRNLMAAALASLSTLSSRSRAELLGEREAHAVLVDAQNELWRGVRLLNDLVDVDRVQKGMLRVRTAPTDLAELLRTVAHRFREGGVDLVIDGRAPVVAEVEAALIDRVMTNLVENAIRHAARGTPVKLRVVAEERAAVFEVENRGASIPPARAAELFEPFVRLEGDEARGAGSGLGLAFCRLATEVHGGTIRVEPVDGGGARFRVRIPR
jgi:signal transduction histidine kinase